MDDTEATSLEQIRAFLTNSGAVRFAGQHRDEVYGKDGADAGAPPVLSPEARREGSGAALYSLYERSEPCAGHEADRRLHRERSCGGRALSAPQVPDPLQERRRGTAGVGGQKPREPERAGDAADTGARAQRIRPEGLRTHLSGLS